MSEQGSDEQQKKADAGTGSGGQNAKVWTDEEVKKIIEERDKAKEKARKHDEDKRKAEEEKAKEEGRYRELFEKQQAELAEAKKKAEAFEADQAKRREFLLSKITDDKMKDVASDLTTAKLELFIDQLEQKQKGEPDNGKGSRKEAGTESPYKAKPGESYSQWQARISTLKK